MTLVELRCPTCNAPLDGTPRDATIKCRFCGASLRESKPRPMDVSARAGTRKLFAVWMERVGPSNRLRVAAVLGSVAGIAPPEAERLVDHAPCELVVWESFERASALRDALTEAGVVARIETRVIVPPEPVVLPDRAVLLDAVGADRVAVMKVVRAHVDLGIADAKRVVERVPCVLVDALEGSRAAAFVAALVAAGATARMR